MADKQFDLVFNAKMEVDNVRKAVSQIGKLLDSADVKLPQSISGNLGKLVTSLKRELDALSSISGTELEVGDAKRVAKSVDKINFEFAQLLGLVREVNSEASKGMEHFFPKNVATNIEKAAKALERYKDALADGPKSSAFKDTAGKIATREQRKAEREATRANLSAQIEAQKQVVKSAKAAATTEKRKATRGYNEAESELQTLQEQYKTQEELAKLEEKRALLKSKRTKYQAAKEKQEYYASPAGQKALRDAEVKVGKSGKNTQAYALAKNELDAYKASEELLKSLQTEIDQLAPEVEEYEKYLERLKAARDKFTAAKNVKDNVESGAKDTAVANATKQIAALDKLNTDYKANEAAIAELERQISELTSTQEQATVAFNKTAFDNLIKELKTLGVEIPDTVTDFEQLQKAVEDFKTANLQKTGQVIEDVDKAAQGAASSMSKAADEGKRLGEDTKNASRAAQEVERLRDNILDFFSITNAINMFKSALRDAFDTVKELDAAMTETAVVTDFSIGDMWDKLPEYSKQASALGTSIVDLYNATTLYYQQGLNTQQSMNIGIETMKMARVANMEGAEATEAMTAALRGFNMELNETSAARISDVYSELAAVTAADTSQIATAMSKTASIASSANMEFETTAALLAQIIETTQEAPETAGTAMKTIIARFTEVKELYDQGLFSGKDSEGEEISINKIDSALKTVGISLKDFLTGTKGIDDIFLELASKWDSLDLATQRYIATTAAGSRQQSRFLAMMSDYDRTMELVNAANNSAGASTEQFNKTLESLDAKLTKLQNSWAEFTMGLANNEVIKIGVDLLTKLLDAVNWVTTAGGNIDGIYSSILKLGVSLIALRSGAAIFDGFTENYGKLKDVKDAGGVLSKTFTSWNKTFADLKNNGVDKLTVSFKALQTATANAGGGFGGFIKVLITGIGSFIKAYWAIGLVVAILGALVVQVIKAETALNNMSKGNEIEGLKEAMAEYTSEIENCRNEIDNLSKSQDELEQMYLQLGNLAKGSEEWKESLVDINQQVLQLIEQYPDLAKFATMNDGVITISQDGWDAAAANRENEINELLIANQGLNLAVKQIEKSMQFDNLVANSESPYRNNENYGEALQEAMFRDKYGFWGDLYENLKSGTIFDDDSGYYQYTGGYGPSEYTRQEKLQMEASGGLTEEQFYEVAKTLVNEGILLNDKDGISETDRAKLQQLYNEQTNGDPLIGSYHVFENFLKENADLIDRYSQDSIEMEQQIQKQEEAVLASIVNANEQALDTGETDAITQIMNELRYSDLSAIQQKKLDEVKAEQASGKSLRLMYHEATGQGYYDAATDTLYSDALMTQVSNIDEASMQVAIATQRLADELNTGATQIAQSFNGKTASQKELIGAAFSIEGQQLTTDQIASYTDGKGGLLIEKLVSDMGYDNLQDMANELGIDINAASTLLAQNFAMAEERIEKARANTAADMAKYTKRQKGQSAEDINKQAAETLVELETKFGEQFRNVINNVISSLEWSGDDELISKGYQKFEEMATAPGTSKEDIQEVANFINEVDWTNPIEVVSQLNKEVEFGSKLTSDYASSILAIGSSALDASAQMQIFLSSDEFVGMKEDLDEIIAANDTISSQDVDDLRDSYRSFDKMLKNTEASIEGVARALTLVAKGEVTMDQLTDAVLASLEAYDSLQGVINKAAQGLEDFEPGVDESQFAEKMGEVGEQITEHMKLGQVNNGEDVSYADWLFPGWDDGLTAQQRVERLAQIGKQLEANSQNFVADWKRLASGKTFFGEDINQQNLSDYEYQPTFTDTGSKITVDGYGDWTTQELTDYIATAYGVGSQYASMMVADMKANSDDMSMKLKENDYQAMIGDTIKEANFVGKNPFLSQDTVHMDQSELDAIAKIWGKDYQTVKESFEAYAKENGLDFKLTNYYDTEGNFKSWDEISTMLDSVVNTSGSTKTVSWLDQIAVDAKQVGSQLQKYLNMDDLLAGLREFNIPEAELENTVDQILEAFKSGVQDGAGYITATLYDGTEVPIQITPEMDYAAFQQELNNLNEARKNEKMAEAFSEIPINLDMEQAEGDLAELKVMIEGTETYIKISGDPDAIAAIPDACQLALDNNTGTYVVNGNVNDVANKIASLPDGQQYTLTVVVNDQTGGLLDGNTGGTTTGGSSHNTDNSAWANREEGIQDAPSAHDALVGDGNGPELIKRADGTSYLSGIGGPEITRINRGDTVYTAEETKDIFKNKGRTMPRFEFGGYNYGNAYNGGSGSGSGSDDEPWENPYDKLYNLVRKIDEELRERERIERRYEKLLTNLNTSANKIISVSREELNQLKREQMLQKQLVQGRRNQIEQWQQENAGMTRYGNVVTNDRGESVLRINWDLIDSVTDSEHGADIEDYISKLEEWFDSLQEAEDALWDIEDTIDEIKERGEEEYFELEDKIKEAVTQAYQDEIDELSAINDSINDTNSNLLDAIQKSIDKQRQDRDNQRTEDDLAEKQRRLLYLSQNTSGANQMEIMQLQKELEEGTEDYTDTLIDQKISELQEQNDEAATQREQQIDLLQAQLDHYVDTGEIWNEVYQLMESGLDPDGGLIRGSRLEEILKNADNFSGLSAIGKQEWFVDLNNMIAQALAYLEVGRQLEDIGVAAGTQIQFTDKNGNVLTGTVDGEGNVTTADGTVYNNVFQGADGKYYAGENLEEPETPTVEGPSEGSGGGGSSQQTSRNPYGKISDVGFLRYYSGSQMMTGNKVKILQWALNDMGYDTGGIDGKFGYMTHTAVMQFQGSAGLPRDGHVGPDTRNAMAMRGYKTGGLADFTGPAWLDGTKARPELVLNQRDTQNFIQLKDILSDVMTRMGSTSNSTENNGDTTYDIDINVESIGSNYDLDQMANYIKNMITTEARYRNNNVVSLKR